MSVVMTFPGKLGDAIMQFPVAYQWAKATGKKFTCWMDEESTKMVAPLFSHQPCVEKVEFKPGIANYNCGGQPWHFDLGTKDVEGHTIYHLGMRSFPVRQITLQCAEESNLPIKIDTQALSLEPSLEIDGSFVANPIANRVILHGQSICPHNRQTPQFWKFLSSIADYLESEFDEVVFVGSERDREIGLRTYPEWDQYDDGGDFLTLARLIQSSRFMIGCGSSPIALAGALKIPAIRVHDPIGTHPKVIWSNLGDNQLNETELDLRAAWPTFKTKWLEKSLEAVNG